VRQKIALLLAGLLTGGILVTALPVGAHHNDRALKRRIKALEARTQLLDQDGFYAGLVEEWQVVSFDCVHGDDAVWADTGVQGVAFLFCADGPYGAQQRQAREDLMKKFARNLEHR
jgi:hypothetical protein